MLLVYTVNMFGKELCSTCLELGERCVSQERNIVRSTCKMHQKLRFIEELVGASQEDIAQGFGCRARDFGVGG